MSSPISGDLNKIISEMFLEVQAMRSELQALRCELAGKIQVEGWLSPSEAAAALKPDGVKSISHLGRLRREGAFSATRGEIRSVSTTGEKDTWSYYIPKCKPALQRHFKRRAG